jgi:hypothetical protein
MTDSPCASNARREVVARFVRSPRRAPRVRSHCRFRNSGTEYVSDSGVKWMRGGTQRQCDRALRAPRRHPVLVPHVDVGDGDLQVVLHSASAKVTGLAPNFQVGPRF